MDLIVTDLAVLACDRPGLRLIEMAPGVTLEGVRTKTGAPSEDIVMADLENPQPVAAPRRRDAAVFGQASSQ